MRKSRLVLNAVVFGLVAVIAFGCSEDERFMEESIVTTNDAEYSAQPVLTRSEIVALSVQKKGSYKISEHEAVQKLKDFSLSSSDNSNETIRTKRISLKKSPKTGKEMYYEIAFECANGAGFSIVSADERAEDILCYSEGSAISDTTFNKSLKFCLDLIDLYVEEQIDEELDIESLTYSAKEKLAVNNEKSDDVSTKALPPFDPTDPNSPWFVGRYDTEKKVEERLKYVPGDWHQTQPFNEFLPILPGTNNQRAYVGCAMVAVSQIMAYHKKPFSNYITTAMWPAMINNIHSSVELKNLMRDLFNGMVVSYDANGTSSNITKARNFLNNNGYTAGAAKSYSYTNVWDALNDGPTYVCGTDATEGGHAWVVDGVRTTTTKHTTVYYCEYNGKVYEQYYDAFTIIDKRVKYNWGWGSNSENNTWVIDNVFSVRNYNFNQNVSIISYIR